MGHKYRRKNERRQRERRGWTKMQQKGWEEAKRLADESTAGWEPYTTKEYDLGTSGVRFLGTPNSGPNVNVENIATKREVKKAERRMRKRLEAKVSRDVERNIDATMEHQAYYLPTLDQHRWRQG